MKFHPCVSGFLKGTDFSNGLKIQIATRNDIAMDRLTLLEKLWSENKIIHLGCADHLPLIEMKIKKNIWLHARLCRVSKRCLGIDLDRSGVDFIRQTLGYEDVLFLDITKEDSDLIKEEKWDFIVLREVLEHIDNPVEFLGAIREKYKDVIKKMIITVPNAFSFSNFKQALFNKEVINTDHRYWFTPYTLAKVVTMSGARPEEFYFCNYFPDNLSIKDLLNIHGIIERAILRVFPALRPTIVMVVAL